MHRINFKTLFDLSDISPKTQSHLSSVYANVFLMAFISACGMFLNQYYIASGFLAQLGSIAISIYLTCHILNTANSESSRMIALSSLAFLMGFNIGPAIHMIAAEAPELLLQALVYTSVCFMSFSALALFSKRRSYLFLGGIIANIMLGMFIYGIGSWIFGYSAHHLPYLLVGLLVACLFIVYDTQLIIERAE